MYVCNMFYHILALYICILPHLTVYLQYILAIHSSTLQIHSTVLKRYIYLHACIHGIKYLLRSLCVCGLVYHVSFYIYILALHIYSLPHPTAYLQHILVIHFSDIYIQEPSSRKCMFAIYSTIFQRFTYTFYHT